MNHSEKIKILKELNEQELRREVLIPLLSKMGYKSPIEYHGVNEKGKDIICYDYNKLNEIDYLSIVAKTTDIKGDVSTERSLREMIYQVEQSFNNRYDDLYSMKQVFINEVWIVTTGKLATGAQESVIDTLRKNNLDKRVKIIYDDRLVSLIDKYFETYWNSANESKETVIIQRDKLLKYIEKLLIQFGSDKATVETIKSQLLYSKEEPTFCLVNDGLFLTSASTHSINIGTIDPNYDDNIHSYECGLIKNQFIKAKESFKYAIWEVEGIIEKAEKVIKLDNPLEFVTEYENNLEGEYPFTRNLYGRAGKFEDEISYLNEGIKDIIRFKKFLNEKKNLEWYLKVAKSVNELKDEFQNVIDTTTEKSINIQFGINSNKVFIVDQANCPDTLFEVKVDKEKESTSYGKKITKTVTIEELIEWSLHKLRKFVEKRDDFDNWEDPEIVSQPPTHGIVNKRVKW